MGDEDQPDDVGAPLGPGHQQWHVPAGFLLAALVSFAVIGVAIRSAGQPDASVAPAGAVPATAPAASTTTTADAEDVQFLACVRETESRGDYSAVSASGAYFGAYQFDQQTWNNTVQHANLPGLADVQPNLATPAAQDQVAMALLQWQGTSPWAGDC